MGMLTVHLCHDVAPLQDYIQAMGACLIQLASGNDASVTDELHQLASEAMTLIACRSKTQQPSVSPVMNEDLMAGTQRNGVMHLDPDHYRRILVQNFCLLCFVGWFHDHIHLCCALATLHWVFHWVQNCLLCHNSVV